MIENLRVSRRTEAANIPNQPPIVETKMLESAFGFGLLYDTLTIEAGYYKQVSASLIRVFVESVLGYEPVNRATSSWSCWEYRRERAFK